MTKLREWLRAKGITVRQFAEEIGEPDSIARKYVYGQRQPSLPKAAVIIDYTGGDLAARDLLIREISHGTSEA